MNPTTSQLQPPVLINTEPLAIIKDEPPESEIMENSIDDIPYSPREDSIKSETVPQYVFETVFVKTENTPFVKVENITESKTLYKTEDTSNGNDQEVIEVQVLGNLETVEQLVINFSNDLNGISKRSQKPEHAEKTEFAECYRTHETTLWEEVNEKIKVIEAPVIPVEPHEYTSLAKDKYICNHCQQAYKGMKGLKVHIRNKHREVTTMYQCPYCIFKSKQRATLRLHIIRKHKDTKDIQWFQYHCDKAINYKTFRHDKFKRHRITHLKPEEIQYFYCYHCSYKSARKCHLKAHIFRHFKNVEIKHEKRHRCDQCGYKTYRPAHLKLHKLNHLKPEEIEYFYCYHCSYKSKQKCHIKFHIFRHFEKEEIKFHCYMCDFMTLKRELIVDHIKRHSKNQIKSEVNEGTSHSGDFLCIFIT